MTTADDSALYPLTPGFAATDTSKDAADEVASKAEVLRRQCLSVVRRAPRHDAGLLQDGKSPDPKSTPSTNSAGYDVGVTVREAAAQLGEDNDNINPRFSELRAAGLIRDSGVRRVNQHSGKMAIAWTVGDDPAKAKRVDNAPPSKPAQKHAYVRGMAAAYYTIQAMAVSPASELALLRRLAELEPGNPEWKNLSEEEV